MTYEEMIATRPQRAEEAKKRRVEWLANADLDQMEIDAQEMEEFESLAGE